jgi:amino acid transporter
MASGADTGGVGLERRVGLPTAIGTTFGLIVASTVLATVTSGFFASYVFLLALAVALLAMFLQSMSFAELATMIPKAGSMNEYIRAGLGAFFATVTVLVGYIAIMLFPTAAEAYAPSAILKNFLWTDGPSTTFWVLAFVLAVTALNIAGIRPYGAVEVALTGAIVVSLLLIGLIGVLGLGTSDPIGSAFPHVDLTWEVFSTLLGVAIFAFVGMEYTCPLAEEIDDPGRNIPRGIFLGLALVSLPLVVFGLAATRYLPTDQLAAFSPTAQMDAAVAILGDTGKWWMGLVSIAATLSTLNALIAGIPRILYGMGLTGQLPRFFAYLLPATRAPVVGIVVVALMPISINLWKDLGTEANFIKFILAGVLGWATAYILIHLTVLILRAREPGARRPFRGSWVPLPQIVGSGLMILAAWKIFPIEEIRNDAYKYYGVFLLVAVVLSLVLNSFGPGGPGAQFRRVPLAEVYRETELIEEELPLPVEPGAPHIGHHSDE